MRKLLLVLCSISLLLLSCITASAVTIVKDDNANVESGYSAYLVGNLGFVIPDYLYEQKTTDDENTISFAGVEDEENGALLSITYTYAEGISQAYMNVMSSKLIEQCVTAIAESAENVKEFGTVEHLTSHGHDCHLSTSSLVNDLLIKTAVIVDDENDAFYIILYVYTKPLDTTKYVSDFYKLLYTDPYAYSTQRAATDPYAQSYGASNYEPTAGDYVDALGSYFNAIGSLSEGDTAGAMEHLGDALRRTDAIEKEQPYYPNTQPSYNQSNSGSDDTLARELEAAASILETLNQMSSQ